MIERLKNDESCTVFLTLPPGTADRAFDRLVASDNWERVFDELQKVAVSTHIEDRQSRPFLVYRQASILRAKRIETFFLLDAQAGTIEFRGSFTAPGYFWL